MNIITGEQTFKQLCSRLFANFANQVERICRLNNQSDKWLSGREVCACLGISIQFAELPTVVNWVTSQIGNKLYYKSVDIETLVAECTVNHLSGKKNNYIPTNK